MNPFTIDLPLWLLKYVLAPAANLLAKIVTALKPKPKPMTIPNTSGVGFWLDLQGYPVPDPPLSCHLTGVYLLSLLGSSAAPEEILLPEGTELDPRAAGSDGRYFVALGFGYQMKVRPAFVPASLGANYLEFVAGVSGVRFKAHPERGTFTCMGRLLLDSWWATVLGKLIGLPKKMVPINSLFPVPFGQESTVFAAAVPPATRSLDGTFALQINPKSISPQDPMFDQYRKFLTMPVLTTNILGQILVLDFGFRFDQAVIQPANATVFDALTQIPGMPPGNWVWPMLSPGLPHGGCRMLIPWEMRRATTGYMGTDFPKVNQKLPEPAPVHQQAAAAP